MKMDSGPGLLVLRLWLQTQRVGDVLRRCTDEILAEYGLTTEQHAVLAAIRSLDVPARPTDLARLLERVPNSVSMLVDRMVKAGLVRRMRAKHDRRVVHVVVTSKGENALKPATVAIWESIQGIMSALSYEEKCTLVSLLEKMKYKVVAYRSPKADIDALKRREVMAQDNLAELLVRFIASLGAQAERKVVRKRKTIRRETGGSTG